MNMNVPHLCHRSARVTDLYHFIILLTHFPSLISLQTTLAFYFSFSFCCLFFFPKCCSCPSSLANCYIILKIQHNHHLSVKRNFLITQHVVPPLLYKRFSQNHVRIVGMPYYALKAEIQYSTNLEC